MVRDLWLVVGQVEASFVLICDFVRTDMAGKYTRTTPWFLWPFVALWELAATIVIIIGRVLGVLLALLLMVVGIALIMTVVGLPIGIPCAILGLLLMVRSIF